MVEWSGKPAYQQVAEKLRERIAAGEFAASGKLPSLSQLEAEYDASVTVVREALRRLSSEGVIVRHQGKGSFLTPEAATLAGQASPSTEVSRLRREVEDLRAELTDLRERVARLEGA